MPRIPLNKKKYLQTDLREWMKGRMDSLGKNQAYMGEKLNISQQAFGILGNRLAVYFRVVRPAQQVINRAIKVVGYAGKI